MGENQGNNANKPTSWTRDSKSGLLSILYTTVFSIIREWLWTMLLEDSLWISLFWQGVYSYWEHGPKPWENDWDITEKALKKGRLDEVSALDPMNLKVDALCQKLDNLSITPIVTATAIAPSSEICRVPEHIGVACQLMSVT